MIPFFSPFLLLYISVQISQSSYLVSLVPFWYPFLRLFCCFSSICHFQYYLIPFSSPNCYEFGGNCPFKFIQNRLTARYCRKWYLFFRLLWIWQISYTACPESNHAAWSDCLTAFIFFNDLPSLHNTIKIVFFLHLFTNYNILRKNDTFFFAFFLGIIFLSLLRCFLTHSERIR